MGCAGKTYDGDAKEEKGLISECGEAAWRSSSVYCEERREEAVGPCAGGFEELVDLPRTTLKVERTAVGVKVTTVGDKLAFFVRVKAMRDGRLVVPVHYSDNYFNLLPGESTSVRVETLRNDGHMRVSC